MKPYYLFMAIATVATIGKGLLENDDLSFIFGIFLCVIFAILSLHDSEDSGSEGET